MEVPEVRRRAFLGRLLDVSALLLVVFVLWQTVPRWMAAFRAAGQAVSDEALHAPGGTARPPHTPGSSTLWVFWATWCAPCHFEMKRLKAAVDEGALDPARVVAINMGEDDAAIRDYVAREKIPFPVLVDVDGVYQRELGVEVTPTFVFINADGSVAEMSTGLSPLVVWKAKRRLAPQPSRVD